MQGSGYCWAVWQDSLRPDEIASIEIDIFHEALRLANRTRKSGRGTIWPVLAGGGAIHAVAENRQFGPICV